MSELSNMVEYYPYKSMDHQWIPLPCTSIPLDLIPTHCPVQERKKKRRIISDWPLAAADRKKMFCYGALLELTSSLRSKNTLRTKRTCDILFHFGQCIYSSKIHKQSPWSTANQKAKSAKGITAFLASIFDSEITPLYTTKYHPLSQAKLLRLVLPIHRCGRIG